MLDFRNRVLVTIGSKGMVPKDPLEPDQISRSTQFLRFIPIGL